MPPFWQLCEQGKLEEVKKALGNGEDVNDSGDVGVTALMSAICNGHKSIIKLLLEHPDIEVNEKREQLCIMQYWLTMLKLRGCF